VTPTAMLTKIVHTNADEETQSGMTVPGH